MAHQVVSNLSFSLLVRLGTAVIDCAEQLLIYFWLSDSLFGQQIELALPDFVHLFELSCAIEVVEDLGDCLELVGIRYQELVLKVLDDERLEVGSLPINEHLLNPRVWLCSPRFHTHLWGFGLFIRAVVILEQDLLKGLEMLRIDLL